MALHHLSESKLLHITHIPSVIWSSSTTTHEYPAIVLHTPRLPGSAVTTPITQSPPDPLLLVSRTPSGGPAQLSLSPRSVLWLHLLSALILTPLQSSNTTYHIASSLPMDLHCHEMVSYLRKQGWPGNHLERRQSPSPEDMWGKPSWRAFPLGQA